MKANTGVIVGGVLGGLAFLLVATATFVCWRKRKQRQHAAIAEDPHRAHPFVAARLNHANGDVGQETHQASARGKLASGRAALPQPRSPPGMRTTSNLLVSRAAAAISRKRRGPVGVFHSRNSVPRESAVPPSSGSNPTPTSGTENLRAEFEQLRREIETIRRITDAPPEYT